MRRVLLAVVVLLGLVAPVASVAAPADAQTYIVEFRPGVNTAAQGSIARGLGVTIDRQYKAAINGFAARMTSAQAIAMRQNPNVLNLEANQTFTIDATQNSATWGLDRIDQSNLPLNKTYTYPDSAGSGVDVFIIDTGILSTHIDFESRVKPGFTAILDGRGTTDCNGHGTHVAGTVAGKTYGVAKAASLIPVRVLNCRGSGTTDGVIAGIDWVINSGHGSNKAVANMSLGGGYSSAINTAVDNLASDGVLLAAAAGNETTDACTRSPASAAIALTVGATTNSDARASYSNFGSCVDLFAPGSAITSDWSTSNSATNTISGTSMASPHVAGIAAVFLGLPSAAYSPNRSSVVALASLVMDATVADRISDVMGSPNNFAQIYGATTTGGSGGVSGVTPPAPAVTAAALSKGRVNVSWNYPDGTGSTPLVSQRIEVYQVTSSSVLVRSGVLSGTTTSASVNRLTVGSTYRFCITGTNDSGAGAQGCSTTVVALR